MGCFAMASDMKIEDKIRANARRAIEQLGPLSGIEFGYNRESVVWLAGYIEQLRQNGVLDEATKEGLVNVLGSYLGECIIHCFGGAWRELDGRWCVALDDGNVASPFAKVVKQMENGLDDSIKGFFDTIPVLLSVFGRPREPRKPW